MGLEERKHIVDGRSNAIPALRAVRLKKRRAHIHHLRQVAHVELVRLAVKQIKAERHCESAAHGTFLPKSAVDFLLFRHQPVMNTPFIEDKCHVASRRVVVEQGALLDHRLLNLAEGCVSCAVISAAV